MHDRESQELNVAMYRLQSNGSYRLVEGSDYELTIDERIDEQMDSFTCRNISLQPSERFSVQQNDVVGFCEEGDTVEYYERSGGTLLRWDARGCSELSPSGVIFNHRDRTFFLSALIGKTT